MRVKLLEDLHERQPEIEFLRLNILAQVMFDKFWLPRKALPQADRGRVLDYVEQNVMQGHPSLLVFYIIGRVVPVCITAFQDVDRIEGVLVVELQDSLSQVRAELPHLDS